MAMDTVREKSYSFAIRVVKLAQYLQHERKEFVLSKQVLRSGTSIGANIEEAQAGQSRKDFLAKMAIASKEAHETHYWIRLLKDTDYLPDDAATSLEADCMDLKRMLKSIVKTTQEN